MLTSNNSLMTCGGADAMTTTISKKCGGKTSSGGQEYYTMKANSEYPYHLQQPYQLIRNIPRSLQTNYKSPLCSRNKDSMNIVMNKSQSSKSVPASTRLEDPSRKGTTRTAKSAPFNPCPSREGPYSTVFSVSRPMDPLMWLAGLLALSGDVETNPGPTTQTWTCDMCSTEITGRQTSYKCNRSPSHWVHKHCTTLIRNTDYTPTWKCNIHNQQNNTITDQHHQLTDNSNNMQQNLNINQPHSINNNKTQQQINSKKTITIIQININGLTTKIHELKNLTDNTKIDIITIQETKLRPTHRTPYLKDYTAIRTDRTYKNGGGLMTYKKTT